MVISGHINSQKTIETKINNVSITIAQFLISVNESDYLAKWNTLWVK